MNRATVLSASGSTWTIAPRVCGDGGVIDRQVARQSASPSVGYATIKDGKRVVRPLVDVRRVLYVGGRVVWDRQRKKPVTEARYPSDVATSSHPPPPPLAPYAMKETEQIATIPDVMCPGKCIAIVAQKRRISTLCRFPFIPYPTTESSPDRTSLFRCEQSCARVRTSKFNEC
jgi:hypothetical protein